MTATEPGTISLSASELPTREAHRLLTSVVAPRPIGWISTVAPDGTPNLAPFSFFNAVSGRPPHVMFCSGLRQGNPKDSLRNARATGEFVVNLVDERLAEAMNLTSGDYPYGVDEFEMAQLPKAPCVEVRPPRVATAAVAMEARVTQIVPIEGAPDTMVIGKVLRFHIREGLLREDGTLDPELLRPVARLGRDDYATLGRIFSMSRPRVE